MPRKCWAINPKLNKSAQNERYIFHVIFLQDSQNFRGQKYRTLILFLFFLSYSYHYAISQWVKWPWCSSRRLYVGSATCPAPKTYCFMITNDDQAEIRGGQYWIQTQIWMKNVSHRFIFFYQWFSSCWSYFKV